METSSTQPEVARRDTVYVDALSRVPLFRDVSPEDLATLAAAVRARRFRRGEVVFHQGDPGDALYVVAEGRVKITLPSDTGDEAILATLRPGDFFGELSLLDGAPRSATAVALDPTETLVLGRDRVRDLIDRVPSFRDALLTAITHELRRITYHVEELHFLDIAGRLAARLARLARESGTPLEDGSIRLDGPLTQGNLAAMIGATRQSVNKLLGLFVGDGLVRIERDAVVVVDLDRLEQAARR
ncbi:MAG TPA: Crp/Fnr family transcriptional regulator [Candidatus Limnocylindrales bacterium]|nr:Crp/Fnr family transcriptional regulator [Candidatus Limnocylindrales bacterium]